MSDSQSIDLSELQALSFRPDWVGSNKPEASSAPASEVVWNFSESKGGRGGGGGRGDRNDRPQGRGRHEGGGKSFGNRGPNERRGPGGPPSGDRPRRDARPTGGGAAPSGAGPRPQEDNRNRGPRPDRGNRDGGRDGNRDRGPRRDGPGRDRFQGGGRGERSFEERPRVPQGWYVRLLPEPRAVEALAKQIKASGRAYSVFDVAKLFLSARDRYLLHFHFKTPSQRPEGKEAPTQEIPVAAASELLQCTLDGSLWLTREEALRHIRESNVMQELYREEVVEVEAPKGNFTQIAVCGFSGALLGPPNHHSYPVNVARLHREKFSNMAIDYYKSRIRTEKGEEVVQKWLDQQTKEKQYVATKFAEGEEPARFKTIAERDAHFLKHHADEALKSVREVTVNGNIPGKLLSPGLMTVLRMELDRQHRFPMHLVQELCRELENHGLKFFKRDKKTTFVCRSRPQFIGNNVPLSERVRSIIEMVRANPGITYAKVVSVLAPPAAEPVPAEGTAEGGEAAAPVPVLSTGELAVMQDIKWLVQEGFLTEFSNGDLHILGRERPAEETKEPREKKSKAPRAEEATTAPIEPANVSEDGAEALTAAHTGEEPEAISHPAVENVAAESAPEDVAAVPEIPVAEVAAAQETEEPASSPEAPEAELPKDA